MKSVLSVLLLSIALPAYAQERDALSGLVDDADIGGAVKRQSRAETGLAPLTSRVLLNGTAIGLKDKWLMDLGLETGSSRNTSASSNLTFVLKSKSDQRIGVNRGTLVYEQEQSSWVLQLRSMDHKRRISTTRIEGGSLTGFKLDFSITGQCMLQDSNPEGYCTYTPSLATDADYFDPDTLTPTAFRFGPEFGSEISAETHRQLKADGFQRGDDEVGITFDIPNAGFVGTAAGRSASKGEREEWVDRRYVPTIARIDQKLTSGSKKAAAARTVRAFVLADPSEYDHRMALAQLSAWLLPAANAKLAPEAGTPNLSISNNLFYALDNAWQPASSFTLFQTGRADVVHSKKPPRRAAETPYARYLGMWLGFSPVRDTEVTTSVKYIPTGERLSFSDPIFRQGGIGTPFADLIDAGVTLFDPETLDIENLNFANIDDLFIQVGLDVTTQDALRRLTTTETSRYRLVPHLSFNGNITGGEQVFRYYAGAIFDDETNAYVGADYTLNTETGWSAYARLDLYSNPDRDYFSEAELRASKTIAVSETRAFTLGVGAITAIDARKDRAEGGSRFALGEGDTNIDVVGRWREGPLDLTLRHRFANEDGSDWKESTTVGVSYAANNRFYVAAQVTPNSDEESYIYGSLALNWRLSEAANAPALQVQYARAKYDLGSTSMGDRMEAAENIFQLGFSAKF